LGFPLKPPNRYFSTQTKNFLDDQSNYRTSGYGTDFKGKTKSKYTRTLRVEREETTDVEDKLTLPYIKGSKMFSKGVVSERFDGSKWQNVI